MTNYRDHLPTGFKGVAFIRGDVLPERLQRDALAAYLHRYTGEHKPRWARGNRPDGRPHPLHFRDDREWLAHTQFPVTVRKDGSLGDHTRGSCRSYPTYPDGLDEQDVAFFEGHRTDIEPFISSEWIP